MLAGVFSEQARIELDVVDVAVEGSQLGLDLWVTGDLIDVGDPGILTCFAVVVIAPRVDEAAELDARLLEAEKGTSLIKGIFRGQ